MIPHVEKSQDQFEEVDLQSNKERVRHVRWQDKVILNRPLQVCIAMVLASVLMPVLVYQFVFFMGYDLHSPDGYSLGSCLVPRSSRLLCGIGNVSVQECHPQCCYDHANHICFHRFPSRFSYILDQSWTENIEMKPRIATVPYKNQNSLTNIRLSLDEVSPTHLTMTFHNYIESMLDGNRLDSKQYEYDISSPELNIMINAKQGNIFNTLRGPMIASHNIWELTFRLTNESMYGFGEIPIKENTTKIIYNHERGLSSIPLIYAKINESYHGLLIDSEDPTEVSFRQSNTVVVRSITNIGLKFHLFVGPRPENVMRDVMKYLQFKTELEYWMLGTHVCSESSDTTKHRSTSELSSFIQEARTQNIPFESHCIKPIVFDNLCETEPASQLAEGVRLLRNADKRFIAHVSPHIIFTYINTTDVENENSTETTTEVSRSETAEELENYCSHDIEQFEHLVLRNANASEVYKGTIGVHEVLYPMYETFSAENMSALWVYGADMDGVFLLNAWPLDHSDKLVNQTKDYLPYFNEDFEKAFNHTPRWNATVSSGEKYIFNHSKYGNHFAKAFEHVKATPTWVSSQSMNGNVSLLRQSVETTWTHLHRELVEAALGGISGHWLWATPICGDTANFNLSLHDSLCVQWYKAATFLPITRIHSQNSSRDPLVFSGTHRRLIINSLRERLSLAPYFYTTLQFGPLLRPMFYQFPEVDALKDVTNQFSVGEDLLVVPNLLPRQSIVHMRMPTGEWYEFKGGLKIQANAGDAVTVATTDSDTLILIRGGSIVPLQTDVRLTAETTRALSSFSMTIALECETNNTREVEITRTCNASGTLYMSTNTSLFFNSDGEKLTITGEGDYDVFCDLSSPIWNRMITELSIFGLDTPQNNYDHQKLLSVSIDLCDLNSEPEIVYEYASGV